MRYLYKLYSTSTALGEICDTNNPLYTLSDYYYDFQALKMFCTNEMVTLQTIQPIWTNQDIERVWCKSVSDKYNHPGQSGSSIRRIQSPYNKNYFNCQVHKEQSREYFWID